VKGGLIVVSTRSRMFQQKSLMNQNSELEAVSIDIRHGWFSIGYGLTLLRSEVQALTDHVGGRLAWGVEVIQVDQVWNEDLIAGHLDENIIRMKITVRDVFIMNYSNRMRQGDAHLNRLNRIHTPLLQQLVKGGPLSMGGKVPQVSTISNSMGRTGDDVAPLRKAVPHQEVDSPSGVVSAELLFEQFCNTLLPSVEYRRFISRALPSTGYLENNQDLLA